MKNKIKVAPSILAGDFGRLADEAKRCEDAGADLLHLDVMDGHFVPNLTMGPKAIAAINRATNLFLDVHIMVYNPFNYIERLIESGADRIVFHFEATEDVEETLQYIQKCNVEAGLAFCPETSNEFIPKFLTKADYLLLMTVHPGFGGQAFKYDVLKKIEFTRKLIDEQRIRYKGQIVSQDKIQNIPPYEIGVDGGITDETGALCVEAGANVLIAGTYLFTQPNLSKGIEKMRAIECPK